MQQKRKERKLTVSNPRYFKIILQTYTQKQGFDLIPHSPRGEYDDSTKIPNYKNKQTNKNNRNKKKKKKTFKYK